MSTAFILVSKKGCPACAYVGPNIIRFAKSQDLTLHVIADSDKELYMEALRLLEVTRVPALFRLDYNLKTLEAMPTGSDHAKFMLRQ